MSSPKLLTSVRSNPGPFQIYHEGKSEDWSTRARQDPSQTLFPFITCHTSTGRFSWYSHSFLSSMHFHSSHWQEPFISTQGIEYDGLGIFGPRTMAQLCWRPAIDVEGSPVPWFLFIVSYTKNILAFLHQYSCWSIQSHCWVEDWTLKWSPKHPFVAWWSDRPVIDQIGY